MATSGTVAGGVATSETTARDVELRDMELRDVELGDVELRARRVVGVGPSGDTTGVETWGAAASDAESCGATAGNTGS